MFDLHCHSHHSDGLLSPEALLNQAVQAGIRVLALTDHDTVSGLKPLHEAAKNYDIHIINGVELSTRWKKYDIHVIGLNVDPHHPVLEACLRAQHEKRVLRAQQIAERLVSLGLEDAYTKACEMAGHTHIGRPHFAKILVSEQFTLDVQSAFKLYLGRGRLAYVPTLWTSIEAGVSTIISAGGQAILAHPHKYKLTRLKLHELIKSFKIAGGVGMEVVSGATLVTQARELGGLCERYELLASTGSDYHGDPSSRIKLGGQMSLPVNCKPVWQHWTKIREFYESVFCNTSR